MYHQEWLTKEIRKILDFLIEATSLPLLPKVDGLFIFGCHDFRVVDIATNLFCQGKADKIIVSGKGKPEKLPGNFFTEASAITSILIKNSIPESAIVSEDKATNTLENVLFGMRKAFSVGFSPRSLILCAKPPLLRRSHATFKKHYPEISTYGADYVCSDEEWQNNEYRFRRILGEITRLQKYAEKGDIARVEIPEEIMAAHDNVIKSLHFRPVL